MRIIALSLLLVIPTPSSAQQLPGLTINAYLRLSGLWSDQNNDHELRDCIDCVISDFGWGLSKVIPNNYTIIDPIGNLFQFSGLHALSFKSIKEINPNLIDIELFFINGTIHKYRINIIHDGDITIDDNGSVNKYVSLKRNYKRINSSDVISNLGYGLITGDSVRIREKPLSTSKIFGLIPNGDKILIIKKSDTDETINSEKWFWYKVISDKGYFGWVYGKYIKFIKN